MIRPGRWAVLLSMYVFLAPTARGQSAPGSPSPPVSDIRVEHLGGGPVEEESVLAFSSLKIGDPFSRLDVSRDVKALQQSGRFAFVGVSVEPGPGGVTVVYQVRGKPRLRRLSINGADYLGASRIRKTVDLRPGDPVDDVVLAGKTREVLETYKKKHFPYARIDWVIEEPDDSGEANVQLLVEEGDRAKIGRIVFEGNEA
ncbi:MAG: hypothetical protein GWO24_32700, partial [Akkermansiaceae bacterium]|nr:hypothetical protein [Akkermansiaceae bacterium]